MQSFLQYRRFRRNIQRQLERDRARSGSFKRAQYGNSQPVATPPDESQLADIDVEKDLEKDIKNNAPSPLEPTTSASSSSTAVHSNDEIAEDLNVEIDPSLVRMVTTRRTIGTQLGISLTGIDVRSRTTNEGKELGKVFVVGYEGENDSLNPHNWAFSTRILATLNLAAITLVVGMASSIDSAAIPQISSEFRVSPDVSALATGIFLIGFGCGAPLSGPLSETVGRNPIYLGTMALYMLFIMGSGLAQNIGQQLACRFLAGLFAATPLVTAGGSISDLWSPPERVYTFPLFANAGFLGPILGPVIGGFIASSSLISWRWTEWITLIISGLVLTSSLLFLPETYAPVLLKWKAHHLRQLTNDPRYVSPLEVRAQSLPTRLLHALYRPFILTAQEPIIILFTLYLTVIYIVLFGFLAGYTYVFERTYSLSQGITGLLFLGIGVGLCLATALVPLILHWAKRDLSRLRNLHPNNPERVKLVPEFRLWWAMLGAPALPISLFWMGWTAYPSISLASPLLASVLFGYGILTVFLSTYQYIIDTYEIYAASALSLITFVRYVAAGGMVEVTIPMYENLGVHWTLTVFACIGLVFTPVPYLFYKYGPRVRKMSKYAASR
jgi:MFS family permease